MTVSKQGSNFYIRLTRSQNITVSKWGQISIFVWQEARIMTASKQSHSSINDCYFTENNSRQACWFRTSAHKIYRYPIIQLALKIIYWHQIYNTSRCYFLSSMTMWACASQYSLTVDRISLTFHMTLSLNPRNSLIKRYHYVCNQKSDEYCFLDNEHITFF